MEINWTVLFGWKKGKEEIVKGGHFYKGNNLTLSILWKLLGKTITITLLLFIIVITIVHWEKLFTRLFDYQDLLSKDVNIKENKN